MKLLISVLLLTLSLSASSSWAEMYRWVDDKGVITYKDYPPPSSKKLKVKTYSDNDFDPAPPLKTQQAPAKPGLKQSSVIPQQTTAANERFTGTVELYVTDWCGYCKKAIAYLKSRNIPYVAYDIEKDSAARQRHKDLGGRGVPLIIIGNNKMSGFSPEVLEHYLGNK